MAEWEDEDFEVPAVKSSTFANKWEGEDEDDDVKDNWEDEDEEKKMEEPTSDSVEAKPAEVKPKNKKKWIIKEKFKELERKQRAEEADEQEEEEISAEEKIRLQQESDLKAALETTFGGAELPSSSGLDTMNPVTTEEFKDFSDALSKKIQFFSKSEEYPIFIETLVRDICATMSSYDLKKIKFTLDNLYLEKQKIEKGDKNKKSKAKGKAKLKLDGDNLNQYSAYVDDYAEFDDFM